MDKRISARNDFEKKFYKDLNNSLFGKTIENQRKYNNIKLVMEHNLQKFISSVRFKDSKAFENKLQAVQLAKHSIILNKPKYLGVPILDISKVIMYEFHYNHMNKFPNKNSFCTDTDSLANEVTTADFYNELKP